MSELNLTINGQKKAVPNTVKTINDLILYLKKNPKHIVVEYNGEVLKGNDTSYQLQNHDQCELIHFVGGG